MERLVKPARLMPLFKFSNVVLYFMLANEVGHFQVVGNMGVVCEGRKADCYGIIFDSISNGISYFVVEEIRKVLIANS